MKKYRFEILAVLTCILVGICLLYISSLKQDIQNMENNFSSQLFYIRDDIQHTYTNIDSILEEKASLLSDEDWSYGAVDMENQSVILQCSVVPKEYQPETTTATLSCNQKEYPAVLSEGRYMAEIPVPLFKQSVVDQVCFTDGGTVRSETLDWYLSPWQEVLPYVTVNLDGNAYGSKGKATYRKFYEGTVRIDISGSFYDEGKAVELQSAALLEYIDEKETKRTEITLNYETYNTLSYPLDKKIEIPFGSTFSFWAEVTDQYGFRYRAILDQITVGEDGTDESDDCWWSSEASVYDVDGNLLYEMNQ